MIVARVGTRVYVQPESTVRRTLRCATKSLPSHNLATAVALIVFLAALTFAMPCIAQQATLPQPPATSATPEGAAAPAQKQQTPGEGQEQTPTSIPALPPAMGEEAVQNPNAPCVQPPPPVTYKDYQGPFAKTVYIFADRLQRKSVGAPVHRQYKSGVLLCTLELKDKFWLFVRDSTDPVAFLNATYNGVIGSWQDTQPTFGHGFNGFLDRFGANMAGQSSAGFFKDFVYPTIFEEDPRYYRLGRGSTKTRVFHAVSHVVVAHNENGNHMFNFSEWLGDASVVVLSNTYLPDNRRGVAPVAISMANTLGNNMGYDVLREFWPEIAKKFHLPFREQNESTNTLTSPD
jgi:hypothetical protein